MQISANLFCNFLMLTSAFLVNKQVLQFMFKFSCLWNGELFVIEFRIGFCYPNNLLRLFERGFKCSE